MLDIVCMKWGDKYHSKYVNRLYNQCIDHIKLPFNFHCITDNIEQLKSSIITHNYDNFKTPKGQWGGRVNTSEKIKAITSPIFKNKILFLDLDLLILTDWTDYLAEIEPTNKPLFIKSPWQSKEKIIQENSKSPTNMNSSIILSYSHIDNLNYKFLSNQYAYNYISFCYRSLDKALFNEFPKLIEYLPGKIAYSYNKGISYEHYTELRKSSSSDLRIRRDDYYVCLFNNQGNFSTGLELHQTQDWAKKYWESYD